MEAFDDGYILCKGKYGGKVPHITLLILSTPFPHFTDITQDKR